MAKGWLIAVSGRVRRRAWRHPRGAHRSARRHGGEFRGGSVSPGSTVKTVEFKLNLLAGVQGDLLAIGEVVRKGRTLATCRLEVVEGNDRVVAIGLATYTLQAV